MSLELHNALQQLALLLFGLFFLFILAATYYTRLIRKKYRRVSLINAQICPICGRKIVREKYTRNIFLFPYLFSSLRHYEKHHPDVSSNARKARIIASLSINSLLFGIILALVVRPLSRIAATLPLEIYLFCFITNFIIASILVWFLVALFLYKVLPKNNQSTRPHLAEPKTHNISFSRFVRARWQVLIQSSFLLTDFSAILVVSALSLHFGDSEMAIFSVALRMTALVILALMILGCIGFLLTHADMTKRIRQRYNGVLKETLETEKHYQAWSNMSEEIEAVEKAHLKSLNPLLLTSTFVLGFLAIGVILVNHPSFHIFSPILVPLIFSTLLSATFLYGRRTTCKHQLSPNITNETPSTNS